jgi:hypothetical protein
LSAETEDATNWLLAEIDGFPSRFVLRLLHLSKVEKYQEELPALLLISWNYGDLTANLPEDSLLTEMEQFEDAIGD